MVSKQSLLLKKIQLFVKLHTLPVSLYLLHPIQFLLVKLKETYSHFQLLTCQYFIRILTRLFDSVHHRRKTLFQSRGKHIILQLLFVDVIRYRPVFVRD